MLNLSPFHILKELYFHKFGMLIHLLVCIMNIRQRTISKSLFRMHFIIFQKFAESSTWQMVTVFNFWNSNFSLHYIYHRRVKTKSSSFVTAFTSYSIKIKIVSFCIIAVTIETNIKPWFLILYKCHTFYDPRVFF